VKLSKIVKPTCVFMLWKLSAWDPLLIIYEPIWQSLRAVCAIPALARACTSHFDLYLPPPPETRVDLCEAARPRAVHEGVWLTELFASLEQCWSYWGKNCALNYSNYIFIAEKSYWVFWLRICLKLYHWLKKCKKEMKWYSFLDPSASPPPLNESS
jgi:hypothetical protein